MIIKAIKTPKIRPGEVALHPILDRYIVTFPAQSILVVTSKVVSICEGRTISVAEADKLSVIRGEAEYFLPKHLSAYGITLAIKGGRLIPSAGVDESNGNGSYVLWPQEPQKTANQLRRYLCRRFALREVGVIISDSTTSPLRWGTTGVAIAHSGFSALKNYIGTKDLFGRTLKVTKANLADALAAAAVAVMGEGREQTPLAVIRDVPFVHFQRRSPSQRELDGLQIAIEEDLYAPLLKKVPWLQGGTRRRRRR